MIRVWSPSSGSTLMTSAPWSASSMVQNGPASICVRSTMRTPSRAPRTVMTLFVLPTQRAGRCPRSGRRGHEQQSRRSRPLRRRMTAPPPHACAWGGICSASLVAPVAAALDQHPALALEDMLVVLVHAVMLEAHDAGVFLVG